jgi:hypothetical protein
MHRFMLLAALAALFAGAAPARAELPPLIPRSVLFGNPVKASPRVSPDGKRLSYLAPDKNDVLQVWVQTIGKDDAKQVTNDKKRGIRVHSWTYAPDTLLYLQDKDGDENFHVFSVNLKDDKVTDLTPFDEVRAMLQGTNRDHPDELLLSMNKRNKRVFDVYRYNFKTGEMKLDTENPGNVISWNTDNDFKVRVATLPTADGGRELKVRADEKGEWKRLLKWGPEDESGGVVGFTKDNKSVYLLTSEGRDTLSLVKRALDGGKETLVAENPKADVAGIIANPDTHEIEAVAFNREKVTWKALDKDIKADLDALEKGAPGEPTIVNTDKARRPGWSPTPPTCCRRRTTCTTGRRRS